MTASSALMVIGHILLCYILLFSFNKPFGHGAATVVERNNSHSPPSLCSGSETGLRGPCSRFGRKKSADTSTRPAHLTPLSRHKAVGEDGSAYTGSFLVGVGFGTPVRNFNLILDTGSSVTWVWCRGCTGPACESPSQQYDPSSSTSSKSLCRNSPCNMNHTLRYLDDSYSKGIFMADTLSIERDNEIPGFGFLCATDYGGYFDNADGILGLALPGDDHSGNFSLISKTATMFGKVFCHCLPSSDKRMGYVYFGEKAHQNCPFSGHYTPMLSDPNGKYLVSFIAVTIGEKRVEISSHGVRAMMDTGTVITRLPSSVYLELRSEFEDLMSRFNPAPVPDDTDNVLHTCYNLQGYDDSVIPNMVLHFDNLDVNLVPAAVISKTKDMSQVCLAFAEGDTTIIGSHQMQKLNILYNIPQKRVEFGRGNC